MLAKIKKAIFNLAPVSTQRKFILRKTGFTFFENEAVDGYTIKMAISPSELWKKRLTTKNGHEPGVCAWLKKNLKDDDVFFDIGTLFGFFSVLVNTIKPTAKVYVFEMSWFHIHYIKINEKATAERFKITPWVINEAMITDSDGDGKLSIDHYVKKTGSVPTLIKMDIDGGEVDAMKGMKNLLAMKKTTWLIEIHPVILAKQNQAFDQILAMIPEGYSLTYLPLVRDDNTEWTSDLNSFDRKEEFFVCIAPITKA